MESYTNIERRNIDFNFLKFCVLDEVDGTLRIGFVEDVELIPGKVEDEITDLVRLLPRAQALHGGIQQSQGEVMLSRSRFGKSITLMATNVAIEDLYTFLASQENAANMSLEVLKALPCLQKRDQSRKARFG